MNRIKQAANAAAESAAGRKVAEYWPQVEGLVGRVDPYRQQLLETVGPLAEQARRTGAHAAHVALERATPVLDDAWERVTPAVETARAKVQGDLIPKLNAVLADAAGHPVAVEAAKRGKATAAALRGELVVPEKKRKLPKILTGLAIVAAIGGVAVALKKYLDSRDAEWEAPAPSTYGGSNTPKRAETSPWAATSDSTKPAAKSDSASAASAPTAPEATGPETAASLSTPDADEVADALSGTKAKTTSAAKSTASSAAEAKAESKSEAADDGERPTYGPGSYVGTKPPAGFEIKGNERSMKFHTPDSPAYERTISDVWFKSAEAAESNGFTKAQR